MKTPMQELLEYVHEEVQLFGSARQILISKIKELLEKDMLKTQSVISLLPNDEDISLYAKRKYPYKKTEEGSYYEGKSKGYAEGAKWMKWKLKNATKP